MGYKNLTSPLGGLLTLLTGQSVGGKDHILFLNTILYDACLKLRGTPTFRDVPGCLGCSFSAYGKNFRPLICPKTSVSASPVTNMG